MSDPNSLRVQFGEEPTFFNRSAMAGAALGITFGVFPASLIGAIIGAFWERAEMRDALENGLVVHKPGFFEKEALKDAVIGMGVLGSFVGLSFIAVMAVASQPVTMGFAITAVVSTIAANVAGFVLGGFHGKSRMQEDWAQAQDYVRQYGEYRAPSVGRAQEPSVQPEHSYKNSLSSEEQAALNARLRENGKREFIGAHASEQALKNNASMTLH